MKKLFFFLCFIIFLLGPLAYAGEEGGDWYPFVITKPRQNIDALVKDINDHRGVISGPAFLYRMNLNGYHFESMDDFKKQISEDKRFSIRPCNWDSMDLPVDAGIERVDLSGEKFSLWRREGTQKCKVGELFVFDGERPILSLYCGNPIVWPKEPKKVPEVKAEIKTEEKKIKDVECMVVDGNIISIPKVSAFSSSSAIFYSDKSVVVYTSYIECE